MAYVKRLPIKITLNKSLNYITNEKKADHATLVTGVNCAMNPKVAYKQMQNNKKFYGKEAGILGFHFVQSFKEGEIKDPSLAHKIGLEWAEKFLDNKYQFIISTHIDKGHVHNHIVINSVSLEGKKYNSCRKELNDIREYSNELSKEYGLSIIEPTGKGKGKQYKEWDAEKKGQSWKVIVKNDIDKAIEKANSFEEFMQIMKSDSYLIKQGNVKYMTFKKEGMGRATRGKTLGEEYIEERIKERIKFKEINLQSYKRAEAKKYYRMAKNDYLNINKFKYKRGNISTNIQLTIALMKIIMGQNEKTLSPKRYKHIKNYSNAAIKNLTEQLRFVNENNIKERSDIKKALDQLEVKIQDTKNVLSKMNELKEKMDMINASIESFEQYKPYFDEYNKATIMKPILKRKYVKELQLYNVCKSKLDSFGLKNDEDFGNFIEKYNEHKKKIHKINLKFMTVQEKEKAYRELEKMLDKIKDKDYIRNVKDNRETREKTDKYKGKYER